MIATDLIEFLAEHDSDITLMVRAHGSWHPVDAVTITSGPDGGLVARLDAADAVAPDVEFASKLASEAALLTLRSHVYSPVPRDTACSCGWDYGWEHEDRSGAFALHVADRLAAAGALVPAPSPSLRGVSRDE